ncbi:MAG: hypothetical protein ACLQVY_17015 [Limisphaerales bacterium]
MKLYIPQRLRAAPFVKRFVIVALLSGKMGTTNILVIKMPQGANSQKAGATVPAGRRFIKSSAPRAEYICAEIARTLVVNLPDAAILPSFFHN